MSKKFIRLTKESAYPVIARYFKGGISVHDFCLKEGISKDQFSLWRGRYMEDHKTPSPDTTSATFHPIEVSSPLPPVRKEQTMQIELEYPNGVILRIGSALSDVRIASLIKLY